MTNQSWQKLSREQKEKWERLAINIEARDRAVQEEWPDLADDLFTFEKISHSRRFRGT